MSGRFSHPRPGVTGVGPLWLGLNIAADIVIAFGLLSFLIDLPGYPRIWFSAAAWVVLLGVAVTVQLVEMRRARPAARRLTPFLAACAVVVALDLMGVWRGDTAGPYPAAAAAVGGLLLLAAPYRPSRDILIAAGALCVVLVGYFLLTVDADGLALGPRVLVLALAGVPAIVGTSVARGYRAIVQVQSDLAQAQSASHTGDALGMLASEQLARLDLAAERMLDDVAMQRIELPLDDETAEQAAALATQLRLHLIEDRKLSWLYHAVTESTVLDPIVTVSDTEGLAASLGAAQRDGLFSALWLLVGDVDRPNGPVGVTLSRPSSGMSRVHEVLITIEAAGVPYRRVDPATWQAISRVGRHTRSSNGTTMLIEIDCIPDTSADR
ncbi:MAG TPA: hypothetical protein VN133_11210 [Humibacter sp.]|nr:hypothetical protein [Humibacter sp.]